MFILLELNIKRARLFNVTVRQQLNWTTSPQHSPCASWPQENTRQQGVSVHLSLVTRSSKFDSYSRGSIGIYMRCSVCATLEAVQVTCAWVCVSFELLLLWFFGLRTVYLRGLCYALVSNSPETAIRVEFCGCHTVLQMQIQWSQEKLCEIVQFLIIIK